MALIPVVRFVVCCQLLACLPGVAGAQGASEWASFLPPRTEPERQTLHDNLFKDITREGPWKASTEARPPQSSQKLIELLVQARWAEALDWVQQQDPPLNVADAQGRLPLPLAAASGHLGLVREMLRRGADANRFGSTGMTPLGAAVFKGDDLVVQELLRAHARLDAPGATGQLPLHLACATGNTRLITLLLKAGADWRWPNRMGHHAVSEAAYRGHLPALQLLADRGASLAEPDATRLNALHAAAWGGQLQVVDWLLPKGVPWPSHVTQIMVAQLRDPIPATLP